MFQLGYGPSLQTKFEFSRTHQTKFNISRRLDKLMEKKKKAECFQGSVSTPP